MGCDIHAYIDYDEVHEGKVTHTSNFGRVHIGRDYWLFTLMAGVRGTSVQGQHPVAANKGLPENISWQVGRDAYLYVVDDEECHQTGCCTRRDAERWGGKYIDDTKRKIQHPDWHSHTWLTADEVQTVIDRYSSLKTVDSIWLKPHEQVPEGYEIDPESFSSMRRAFRRNIPATVPVDLLAVAATMRVLEEHKKNPRLVVWFDN